jgi:hypothetical protein
MKSATRSVGLQWLSLVLLILQGISCHYYKDLSLCHMPWLWYYPGHIGKCTHLLFYKEEELFSLSRGVLAIVVPMEITFMGNRGNKFVLCEFIDCVNSHIWSHTNEFIHCMNSHGIHIGFWFLPWTCQLSVLGKLRESSSKYTNNNSIMTRQNCTS